jgi:multidrug efflux system outer membrane protein
MCLSGCIGIPSRPQAPELPGQAPLSELPAGGGSWPREEWWRRYADPDLDRLVDLALASSPTLASARARFDSARESVRIAGAESGAHLQAEGDANRQRLSDNGLFPPELLGFHWYDQYDLGLQASYTFDWWGKQRDAVQAAIDLAHAAQVDRIAARLVLASSIADAYFGWQADQSRLSLAREQEAAAVRQDAITAARIGADIEAEGEANRTAIGLAAVRERIAQLQGSARLRIVTLAALVGSSPEQLPTLTPRPLPAADSGIPDNVRLDLIARRADLAASRWRVEAAQKNREAARAEFYPDISINALIGLQSRDIGKLLLYDSRVPQFGAAVHLPIFDAGRLQARYGASQAMLDAAVAAYRDTLVSAAREVATQAASRAQILAERAQRQVEVDAAARLRAGAAARARQGLTDLREELTADQSWLDQRDALIQLDAAALASDIGLQRALGGGYEKDDTLR